MRAVALRMRDTPYVLKGGTALALLYGLDRHSVDLDFDIGPRKLVPIENDVRDGLRDVNVSMSSFRRGRPMWKGRRFNVHYTDPGTGVDRLLKVELSFRTEPGPDEVVIQDGIRTYKISALFDQKMNAADDRTKARDLYDLEFLVESHGDSLSTRQIRRADGFSKDYQGLATRYRRAFRKEPLLKDLTTADDRALAFRIGVVKQMHRRRQPVVEQAVPSAASLADALARHEIWLESDGQEGSRADLSDRNFSGAVLCGVNLEAADLQRADFTGADLRNANLRSTNLSGAVFDGTDLRGADFSGSDLTDISLRRSMLRATTKGLAEALKKVDRPRQSPSRPYRRVPRRAEPEREFGQSR